MDAGGRESHSRGAEGGAEGENEVEGENSPHADTGMDVADIAEAGVATEVEAGEAEEAEEEAEEDAAEAETLDVEEGDDADDEEEEEGEEGQADSTKKKRAGFASIGRNKNSKSADDAAADDAAAVDEEHDDADDNRDGVDPRRSLLPQIPLSRVKTVMKLDPEVTLASQEAVALVAVATQMFVAAFAAEAAEFTLQHKKKTIQRRDVDAAIDADPKYAFLEGMIDF